MEQRRQPCSWKANGKDKPLHISIIKQRNDQSPQNDALGAVSDERKDDDDDYDDDDLVPLSQFQEKTSAISCDKTSIYDLQDQSKKRFQSQEIESSNINLQDEDDISLIVRAKLRSLLIVKTYSTKMNVNHIMQAIKN